MQAGLQTELRAALDLGSLEVLCGSLDEPTCTLKVGTYLDPSSMQHDSFCSVFLWPRQPNAAPSPRTAEA